MTDQAKGYMVAVTGVLTLSPDTLLVRLLAMEQWQLQFYRGMGVALVLFGYMFAVYGRRAPGAILAVGRTGILAAVGFAASTILFISSLYLTSVANTLAIISAGPLFGAVISWLILRERLPLRTWIAAFLALCCVLLIVSQSIGHGSLAGDLLALSQAICWSTAFVLVRRRREVNMVPCMALAGVFVAAFSLLWSPELAPPAGKLPLLALLCLGVLPISFGCISAAPRWITAPEVSMVLLLEMILGPLLVWAVVGETVPRMTLVGGSGLFLVLSFHSLLAMRQARRADRVARKADAAG